MAYVMGVDIGGTNTRAMAVGLGGNVVGPRIREPSRKDQGVEGFINHVAEVIEKAKPESSQGELLGVGVGLPGPVNPKQGLLYHAPNLPGFHNVPVSKMLSERLGVSVFVDNDANCAVFGEHRFGAAQNKNDFLMLTFGTGIGGGVFMDGSIRHGKSGGSGEIGHLCLYPGGLQCGCGRRGCFEKYVSAITVLNRAKAMGANIEAAHEIYEAFDKKEEWALGLLDSVSTELATALGTLINIFEPEAIVLGGGLFVQKYESFLNLVQKKLAKEAFPSALENFSLLVSGVPGNAGLLGAAALALSKVSQMQKA